MITNIPICLYLSLFRRLQMSKPQPYRLAIDNSPHHHFYSPQHAPLFTTDGRRLVDAPFLRALNSPDMYLQRSASLGLACLYTVVCAASSSLHVCLIYAAFGYVVRDFLHCMFCTLVFTDLIGREGRE